jgi:UPF0271 protein
VASAAFEARISHEFFRGQIMIKINLNADMAEGFGAYDIGDDLGILEVIGSANIACGFHAGDPNTMHRVVMEAKRRGVSIGAHPGFNDLWGFGRRRIDTKPADLEYMIAYQIGALQAIAAYADAKVTHLKPHGALNNMAAEDKDYALAIGRAIKAADRNIIYVALAGSEMEKAGRHLGLPVALEGFAVRRRRQSDVSQDSGIGHQGSCRCGEAGARHGREQVYHVSWRQKTPMQGSFVVRAW